MDLISIALAGLFVLILGKIGESRTKQRARRQKVQDSDESMKVWMNYHLHIDSSLDAEANFPDPVHASMCEIDDYINKIDRLDVALRYLDITKERKAEKRVIKSIELKCDILYLRLRRELFGS